MKLLKKVISLLLVVAMLGSFTLVASAEDDTEGSTNLVLKAYRTDGTEISADNTVTAGETIKVRVVTTEEVLCNAFVVLVDYDSSVLTANRAASKKGTISSEFDNTAITTFISDKRDEEHVPVGTPSIQLTYGAGMHNVTAPAGTVWAEFDFTTLKETDGTTLTAHLTDGTVLKEVDHGDDGILLDPFKLQGIVPGNVTVAINAAPVAVESVAVTPDSVTLNPGKTQQLTAEITPSGAEATVAWKSDNEEVATVSDAGLVTAVGVGDTVITATADGKTATCAVKVEAADPITKFECYGVSERSILVNGTTKLNVSLATSDGSEPEVAWTVTGDDCVTISGEGKTASLAYCTVTGAKLGTAYVTATSGTHSVTFTVEVLAALASRVTIDDLDTDLKYAVGTTIPLKATVTPAGEWDIKWTSSDPTVARVEGDKLITVGAGTVTVTAKAGGKTASKTITVVDTSTSDLGDYTADMPEDATQRVASGQKVSIPITIAANSAEAFNDVDLTVTFDPTKLEAVNQVEGLDGCTVSIGSGKIRVFRYGVKQAVPTVLKLSFNVTMTEGTTDVVLAAANVDLSANALIKDVARAAITRATTTLEVVSTHTVTLPDTMGSNQGTTVADGEDYSFYVKDKDAYHDYDVKATMGGTDVDVTENEDGTYTIKSVTGDVTVQMTATAKSYNVDFLGQTQDVTGESTATYGKDYSFTVKQYEGYTQEVKVKIGGKDYPAAGVNGTYTIPGADVKGDIQITVTKKDAAGATVYAVTVEGSGASDVTADAVAKEKTAFAFKLTPEANYAYTVEVAVNGTTRKPTVVTNEDGTKTYNLMARYITGNILITVTKDAAWNVNFELQNKVVDSDGLEVDYPTGPARLLMVKPSNAESTVKKGGTYTFDVTTFAVYDLKCEVTENGAAKEVQETVGKVSVTNQTHTFTIENVQGDLNIKITRTANMNYVDVQVTPFVELDDKTVFLVATYTKADAPSGTIQLDTYDGHPMYMSTVYKSAFTNPSSRVHGFLWLTIVPKGETFGVEQALEHLYYTNNSPDRPGANSSAGIKNNADVNLSGMVDINDAQLIFDIYNGEYQTFYRTNAQETASIPNYGVGASMDKFMEADVNRDMKITLEDAAAIIDKIK